MLKQFFIGFLFLSALADAETLFYKKDGSPITPQEHDVIYKIMLETQFPMSVAYGNYYEDEIKAMNEKIQKQLPKSGIQATFIPTTLYELLVLKFIEENSFTNLEKASFLIMNKKNNILQLNSSLIERFYSGVAEVLALNKDWSIIQLHLAVNNFIISLFVRHKILLPIDFNTAIKLIKRLNLEDGVAFFIDDYANNRKGFSFDSVVERATAIEYQAHNRGQMVLYRGSEYVDDFFDPKLTKALNRSISFAASLFGGLLFDKEASAFFYMLIRRRLGYVVFIDKKTFFNGKINNMFYIPPVITLVNLIGIGEYFHPRTKVISLDENENVEGLSVFGKESLKAIPYYQIKATTKEEVQKIYNEILQYIKEHHLVFKDKPKARL